MADRNDSGSRTAFREWVLTLVRAIPEGRVATYGQIAGLAGRPRAARVIGGILRSAPDPELPWHRVVNAQGGISTYRIGAGELQAALLRSEGVAVREGALDLAEYRWRPVIEGGAVRTEITDAEPADHDTSEPETTEPEATGSDPAPADAARAEDDPPLG